MDLEFFMPPEKIPQALKALDVDGDGKISLADMRDAVIQVQAIVLYALGSCLVLLPRLHHCCEFLLAVVH